jgi:hypothetical protein
MQLGSTSKLKTSDKQAQRSAQHAGYFRASRSLRTAYIALANDL